LSEFLQRLQARLKAKKQGHSQGGKDPLGDNHAQPTVAKPVEQRFLANVLSFFTKQGKSKSAHRANSGFYLSKVFNPSSVAQQLSYLLMLLTIVSALYWFMRIAQIPGVPGGPANGISKGSTLYSNQDPAAAYGLFGNKPLATDNIYLRGVVITSKSSNGALDGFAIFEIDGKPTNAISVGESLGKGLTLQGIGDESATLLYQGQRLNFKLSKSGKDKSSSPSKSK
jgi:hypothetical protein